MLIEYGIQVIIISARIAGNVAEQHGVAVVDPFCVVVLLPELDGSEIGFDKDGAAEEWIHWCA